METTVMEKTMMINGKVTHDPNLMPSHPEQHLQLLKFNKDGDEVLVVSNELSGSTRTAALFLINSEALDPSKISQSKCDETKRLLPSASRVGTESDSCVMDAVFVASDQLLLAMDDGSVARMSVDHSKPNSNAKEAQLPIEHLDIHLPITEHDAAITRMDLNHENSRLLTSSVDRSILVWDTMTLAIDERLDHAHHDLVSSVSFNPVEKHVFASASNDGVVGLWDLRAKNVFVNAILKSPEVSPIEVAWTGREEQQRILVGDEKGVVHLFDLRTIEKPLCSFQEKTSTEPVHRIAVHPKRSNVFATCRNSPNVTVTYIDESDCMSSSYDDDRHVDVVRGLAWRPNSDELWTCGWDTAIIVHQPQLD